MNSFSSSSRPVKPISPESPMSRPRTLNVFKLTEIIEVVAAGGGLAAAARSVGCSVATIRRETLRNQDFARDLRIAQRDSEMAPLQSIRKAAATEWRAAAWLLERTNPERFDRRRVADAAKARDIDDSLEAVIQAAVEEIDDPQLRLRIARRLIAAGRRSPHLPLHASSPAPPSRPPVDQEQRRLDALLDELSHDRDATVRGLLQDLQNPPRCA